MKISVIVPVYNEEANILELLRSFERLDFPERDMEVIVIDNLSKDRTRQIVEQFPYTLLTESKRTSYAARNLGITRSHGDVIAFTDGDCVVSRSWVRDLLRGFNRPEIGGVAGLIIPLHATTLLQKFRAQRSTPNHRPGYVPNPFAVTANVAYRRSVFKTVGLFDDRWQSGSDVDLAWRMQKHGGFALRFLAKTGIVYHRNVRSILNLMDSARAKGYGTCILVKKHPDEFPQPLTQVRLDALTLGKMTMVRIGSQICRKRSFTGFLDSLVLEPLQTLWQLSWNFGAILAQQHMTEIPQSTNGSSLRPHGLISPLTVTRQRK